MSIRNKIILYFSVSINLLLGIALFFIYTFFSEYREEEFQQRQEKKISNTLRLLAEIRKDEEDLLQAIDQLKINELFDEKILIYNRDKLLIYASLDDTQINHPEAILSRLSDGNKWVETKEDLYDVVGVYVETGNNIYYGISKAYDSFGYSKLNFLRYILIFTFLNISLIIFLVAYFLSSKITHSITNLTQQIKAYNFEKDYKVIVKDNTEISTLALRFNELMQKTKEAFEFQKHAIHHISHELKTPISILVSNFEKIERENDIHLIKEWIHQQKERTKVLADLINSLLEIAKIESGDRTNEECIRMDELIFDLVEEVNELFPNFQFLIEYKLEIEDENQLSIKTNKRLIRAAILNLMINCVQYSNDQKATIYLYPYPSTIKIEFINNGRVINEGEHRFLFQHFFRGENSKGKSGFGLGLVLVQKILSIYGGEISYISPSIENNRFTLSLPNLTGEKAITI